MAESKTETLLQRQPDPRVLAATDPARALEMALEESSRLQKEAATAKAEVAETRLLAQMTMGKEGLEATNSAQLWWLAGIYYRSGAAPKDDMADKSGPRPERDVRSRLFLKMSFGAELGLKPLQALQNVAIINNRPCIWGDAAKALVFRSGLCEYIYDEEVGERGKQSWGFRCRTKRKGQDEETTTFTMADAQTAGLVNKPGDLYKLYPQRMLMFRARGFRLRDSYPDVLKGLITAEEARDIDVGRFAAPEQERFRHSVQTVGVEELLANAAGADEEKPQATPQHDSGNGDGEPANEDPTPSQAVSQSPDAEDEAVTVAQWREQIPTLTTLKEIAEARANMPKVSDAAYATLNNLLEMAEAAVKGKRGPRSNKPALFDASQPSATEQD